jgi:hypothetical protein
VGWSRSIGMPLERRVSVTWSRSGALRPCIGRGYDADDVLRVSGRHLRLIVYRRDRYVAVAGPARGRSPRA